MRARTRLAAAAGVALMATPALASHGIGLGSDGWSPLTAALVFGSLALLVGAVVVILVTVFSKRDTPE